MIKETRLLFKYMNAPKFLVSINIVLMVIMSFLHGISISLLVPLLQTFSGDGEDNLFVEKIKTLFIFVGIPFNFNTVTITFAIMIILRILMEGLQNHYSRVLSATFSTSLQYQMFENIIEARLSFFYKRKVGDLISTLFTSSVSSGGMIAEALSILKGLFLIGASLIAGCFISIEMTLFVLSMSIISIFLVRASYRTMNIKAKRYKELADEIHSYEFDLISGIKTVMGFNNKSYHKKVFSKLLASFRLSDIKIMDSKVMASMIIELFLTLILIALLFITINFWNTSIISLVTVLFIFVQIAPQIKGVNRGLLGIKQNLPHISKIDEIIKRSKIERAPSSVSSQIIEFSSEICLKDVRFRYNEDDPEVLKGINLTIKKGETVALVGNSGAGKTTLVDLIMRHHVPTSGQVIVDSKNLTEHISLKSWRNQIAIVEQSPYIFNTSIYQNILYGKHDSSLEEVYKAGLAAYADGFIRELPDGYDTIVGNRGMTLSGGQQQRIALARAMLMKPKILILDEATSALDSESEKQIQLAIENYKKESTLIVIAHRLSTITNADEIVFLENGRIEEIGSHDSLIRLGKRYNDFYKLQYFSRNAVPA